MLTDRWPEGLVSPLTRQKLHYLAGQNRLESPDGTENYPVVGKVPNLLPVQPAGVASTGEVHEKLGTAFHYRDHYEKDAEVYDYFNTHDDAAGRHESRRLHEAIIRQVPPRAESILDAGCGSAWVARHFCPRGVAVCSMDVAPRNPQQALARYPFAGHYALVADVYALPFLPASFDCIIAAEVIEHTPDPLLFTRRLLEVLRPGGTLIITTPFEEKIAYSLCVHCNRPTPHHAHLHSFTKAGLARLVNPEAAAGIRLQAFNNKALTKLRTHVLLQYLPAGAWRRVDALANAVVHKPARLMMCVVKK